MAMSLPRLCFETILPGCLAARRRRDVRVARMNRTVAGKRGWRIAAQLRVCFCGAALVFVRGFLGKVGVHFPAHEGFGGAGTVWPYVECVYGEEGVETVGIGEGVSVGVFEEPGGRVVVGVHGGGSVVVGVIVVLLLFIEGFQLEVFFFFVRRVGGYADWRAVGLRADFVGGAEVFGVGGFAILLGGADAEVALDDVRLAQFPFPEVYPTTAGARAPICAGGL